jgi:hypothetical protein
MVQFRTAQKAKMISSVDISGALERCELEHLGLLTYEHPH